MEATEFLTLYLLQLMALLGPAVLLLLIFLGGVRAEPPFIWLTVLVFVAASARLCYSPFTRFGERATAQDVQPGPAPAVAPAPVGSGRGQLAWATREWLAGTFPAGQPAVLLPEAASGKKPTLCHARTGDSIPASADSLEIGRTRVALQGPCPAGAKPFLAVVGGPVPEFAVLSPELPSQERRGLARRAERELEAQVLSGVLPVHGFPPGSLKLVPGSARIVPRVEPPVVLVDFAPSGKLWRRRLCRGPVVAWFAAGGSRLVARPCIRKLGIYGIGDGVYLRWAADQSSVRDELGGQELFRVSPRDLAPAWSAF